MINNSFGILMWLLQRFIFPNILIYLIFLSNVFKFGLIDNFDLFLLAYLSLWLFLLFFGVVIILLEQMRINGILNRFLILF